MYLIYLIFIGENMCVGVCVHYDSRLGNKIVISYLPGNFWVRAVKLNLLSVSSGENQGNYCPRQKTSDNSFLGLLHYLETIDWTFPQLGMK
jgi:hypothetical protein